MDDFEQKMVSLMLNPFVRFGERSHYCGRVFSCFDVCRRSGRISPVPAERPESRRLHKSLQQGVCQPDPEFRSATGHRL